MINRIEAEDAQARRFAQPIVPVRVAEGAVSLFLKAGVLSLIFLLAINAAIYQFEVFAFAGRAPISTFTLKIALLVLFFGSIGLSGRIGTSPLMRPAYLFFAYLVADLVHLVFQENVTRYDFLVAFNGHYFVFLLVVIAASLSIGVPNRLLEASFVASFLMCAAIGILQSIQNSPILPTESIDGNFKVGVWNAYSTVRAFSLFNTPQGLSMYASLAGAFAIAKFNKGGNRLFSVFLFCLAVVCCLVARTREEYVGFVEAAITAGLLSKRVSKSWVRLAPLAWLAAGISVAFIAAYRLRSVGLTADISDAGSVGERLVEWGYYSKMITSSHLSEMLFGFGITQDSHAQTVFLPFSIDNLYLALVLNLGLVGLMLFLMMVWRFWTDVCHRARNGDSAMVVAAAAVFSTILCQGLFIEGFASMTTFLLFAYVGTVNQAQSETAYLGAPAQR